MIGKKIDLFVGIIWSIIIYLIFSWLGGFAIGTMSFIYPNFDISHMDLYSEISSLIADVAAFIALVGGTLGMLPAKFGEIIHPTKKYPLLILIEIILAIIIFIIALTIKIFFILGAMLIYFFILPNFRYKQINQFTPEQ